MAQPAGKLSDPTWRKARARKAAKARAKPTYHLDQVRKAVERSRQAQGLPPVVTDELTLAEVARLLTTDAA